MQKFPQQMLRDKNLQAFMKRRAFVFAVIWSSGIRPSKSKEQNKIISTTVSVRLFNPESWLHKNIVVRNILHKTTIQLIHFNSNKAAKEVRYTKKYVQSMFFSRKGKFYRSLHFFIAFMVAGSVCVLMVESKIINFFHVRSQNILKSDRPEQSLQTKIHLV